MNELLKISGLTKSFNQKNHGKITILRGIDLTIGEGETLCVLGESGCGKTTLGKIIAGLSDYSEGSYLYEGKEVSQLKGADKKEFRSSVQMIHQNPYESLNPTMMVFDMIAAPLRRHKGIKSIPELYQRVSELLTLVGLTPVEDFVDKYPQALSGGQRQRVSIARVLAMEPKLIVVDEATSMIDTSLRINLLQTLRDIQEKLHVSYFFITHDLALGKYFARGHKVMIMYMGKVVEESLTDDLVAHPCHPYTKAILSAAVGSSNLMEHFQGEHYYLQSADIPSFRNVPPGCSLHPRCPQMIDGVCNGQCPELMGVSEGHKVACHLYEERKG